MKTFSELGLPQTLVASLEAGGFTTPTKIQAEAIPQLLKGRDMLGIAQTGSGKTAAFGLPILTALMNMPGKARPMSARALILAPTRELAVQIEEAIRSFAGGAKKLSTVLVLGGVSRYHQVQKIAKGVDVMVATPGRLMDLMDDKKVWLAETKFLVLDEADRMLDMGFIGPVKAIAKAIGHERQTMLFSATMADNVANLAKGLLKEPVRVEASPQGSTVVKIEQRVILSGAKAKRGVLNELLADEALSKVIIFSRTKHGADKVVKNLTIDGHSAAAIHGNKSQNARQAALKGFTAGTVRLLVATDIASRGIDVPNISHVINYELPDDAENYVHRIGRTGRNGASGIAITLVDGAERSKLRDIERLIRRTLPVSGDLSLANSTGVKAAPAGFAADDRPARSGPRTQRNPKARTQAPKSAQPRRNDRQMGSFSGLADDLAGRGTGHHQPSDTPRGKPAHGAGKPAAPNGKAGKPRWDRNQKQAAAKSRRAGGDGAGRHERVA